MNILLVVRNEESLAPMARWCGRLAYGAGAHLRILTLVDEEREMAAWQALETNCQDPRWCEVASSLAGLSTLEVETSEAGASQGTARILEAIETTKPDLLVMQDRLDHPESFRQTIEQLLDKAHCAVMILRLGLNATGDGRILVPCAGGPNSKFALKLAADAVENEVTAFFVEPDVDTASDGVGHKQLERFIRKAGVTPETVQCQIALSESISQAIHQELTDDAYGLLLIGASGASTLRRKLFGTVPERLLKGEEAMSIGVIRGPRPAVHRLRQRLERMMLLTIPQLSREERIGLFDEIEEKSRWSFDFAALMAMATAIAALGLLADSGAVVIGAMLVAPLMVPLLGGGLALVQGNWPLWKSCQKSVVLGFIAALSIGVITGWIARLCDGGMTNELMARGAPSLLDLGVAFISGIAASYCLARPRLSGALAGVAIAAALVPPIATVGISLAMSKFGVAQGAALLFGTNVVAIVIGSAFNFFLAGIRGKTGDSGLWSRRMAIVFALVMVGLMVPLSSSLVKKLSGQPDLTRVLQAKLDQNQLTLGEITPLYFENGTQIIELRVETPRPLLPQEVAELQAIAEKYSPHPVKLRVRSDLIQVAP